MKKIISMFAVVLGMILVPMVKIEAAETITLLEITEDAEMVDSIDGNKVLATLERGSAAFYAGEEKDGWTKVVYQGTEGYVLSSKLQTYGNQSALDKEFENISNDNRLFFEEVLQVEKEELQSLIWGTIIIGLVIAIFGVSILSGIKKNKEEQKYRPIYKEANKKKRRRRKRVCKKV